MTNNGESPNNFGNQLDTQTSLEQQEMIVPDFLDITNELTKLTPELGLDEYGEDLEYLFSDIDDELKQQLLTNLQDPNFGQIAAEVLIQNSPIDDLENIILLIEEEELKQDLQENKIEEEEKKQDLQENKTENQKTLNEKTKEFGEANKNLIDALENKYTDLKNSPEGQDTLKKAEKEIKAANPDLSPADIKTYAQTYLLLEHRGTLDPDNTHKTHFDELEHKVNTSEVFRNIIIVPKLKEKGWNKKQIDTLQASNTNNSDKIKFIGDKVVIGRQEFTALENGGLQKDFVSENGNIRLSTEIEYKTDYALLAEKRSINREISKIDTLISDKDNLITQYKEFALDEKNDLNNEADPALKKQTKENIDKFEKKIQEIEAERNQLLEDKEVLVVQLESLESKESMQRRLALSEQSENDDEKRDILDFMNLTQVDIIGHDALFKIFDYINNTSNNIDLGGGIIVTSINLNNFSLEGSGIPLVDGNPIQNDQYKEIYSKIFNKFISGNPGIPINTDTLTSNSVAFKSEDGKTIDQEQARKFMKKELGMDSMSSNVYETILNNLGKSNLEKENK